MEFDFIDITLIVFLSMFVALLIGFAVHFYREGNKDDELLNNPRKIKIEEP